jgi:hypothetical protein
MLDTNNLLYLRDFATNYNSVECYNFLDNKINFNDTDLVYSNNKSFLYSLYDDIKSCIKWFILYNDSDISYNEQELNSDYIPIMLYDDNLFVEHDILNIDNNDNNDIFNNIIKLFDSNDVETSNNNNDNENNSNNDHESNSNNDNENNSNNDNENDSNNDNESDLNSDNNNDYDISNNSNDSNDEITIGDLL